MPLEEILNRPSSAVIYGSSRPLLNWVAYSLASAADAEFHWTDVRLVGEVLADADPLARDMIPPDRLTVRYPHELLPRNAEANTGIAGLIRDEESLDTMKRLLDFIRLPIEAQRLLSKAPSSGRTQVFVLSNGHRLVSSYPPGTFVPILGAIVGAGVAMLMTFADSPPESHRAFDTALDLDGNDPRAWREATLRVERGPSDGPFRAGSEHRLGEVHSVAAVLARELK